MTRDADVADVSLQTHGDDVLTLLRQRDLHDVIVVGHSYSGIVAGQVAGQVADRVPERMAHTVYVDAFVPSDGRSMLDAFSKAQRADELRQIAEHGGRWPAPNAQGVADGHGLTPEQAEALARRLVDHPGRTVSEPAVLRRPVETQRATYIVCAFQDSEQVAALRQQPSWTFHTLRTGHWPMVSAPGELAALLAEVADDVP